MKRILFFLAVVAATLVSVARPVSEQRARQLVERHFFAPAVCVSPTEWSELYVFVPASGEGFVVVSADDCARPVLAYSYSAIFSVDGMPAHVADWIDGYRRELADLVKLGATPAPAVQALWQNPKAGGQQPVEPLMTTTWNQRPLYNLMCPYDINDSAYCVTGCTATATAQVMKYWNHPEVGWGSRAYNTNYGVLSAIFDTTHYRWNLMPNALTSLSDSAEIMAVAELMYHVGVAVNMNYSPSASGAAVNSHGYANYPSAETALKTYFKYSPLLYSIYKEEHSDAEWDNLIASEILASRPVLYAGYDPSGGHAFVLDGIDSVGMFHVNWGWGGAYDGYYTTDSLSPGAGGVGGNATYTFNLNNSAVIGIQPAVVTDDTVVVVDMRFDSTMGNVSGNGTYTPFVDDVTIWAHAAEGYRFERWAGGSTENPLFFLANGNISDSAIFAPVHGDTVGYCDDAFRSSWHDDYGNVTQWGIRVAPALRHSLRSLTAVQLYVYEPGYYTMCVYCGESISPETRVVNMQPDLTEAFGWTTIELDEPLYVPDDQPLWITFRFTTATGYPATSSHYTAASDGCWYKLPDGWRPIDETGVYQTWMIRALFAPRPCRVSIENAGHCELDSFSGAGDYALGSTATVSCSDPYFTHWEGIGNSSSSITFTVTGDTTFYAYCFDVGIDEVEPDDLDQPVSVYDMMGRCVATRRDDVRRLPSGVYLLRRGNRTVEKIVVL